LGDVLLHAAFYAKIGSETGDFDIKDVCDKLCDKLIFRHPHVFGEVKAETAGQVSENWEQLKLKEKDGNKSVLSGVPSALPSLIKAYRIQDKARNVGFDWEEREQVWDKVKEEIREFQVEVANMDKEKAEAEFGDVMFSLINAGTPLQNQSGQCFGTNQSKVHPPFQLPGGTYDKRREKPQRYVS